MNEKRLVFRGGFEELVRLALTTKKPKDGWPVTRERKKVARIQRLIAMPPASKRRPWV